MTEICTDIMEFQVLFQLLKFQIRLVMVNYCIPENPACLIGL